MRPRCAGAKERLALIAQIHVSRLLAQYAQTLKGMEAFCFQAYAEALEVIPTTLAENGARARSWIRLIAQPDSIRSPS